MTHDIVLTTLNARYWHSSFGLRYLLANMGDLTEQTVMLEFGIGDSLVEVLADVLQYQPRIVGIGVYVWNVRQATELVANIKRVAPETVVVLGGPEVSYETDSQPIVQMADYVITGEADLAFPELCHQVLNGASPPERVVVGAVSDLSDLELPYHLYNEEDIAHRVIYVEASRGCPFTCEFCLSALEIPVRQADIDRFLAAMKSLLDRGARHFKFVDRTFNLNLKISQKILSFFLEQWVEGTFLHFEMIPDRLPDSLRATIRKFPEGALQFEIGVQTFNDQVGELISRRQDNNKLEDNFRFLRQHTGVHIHADLIVGLPGEDLTSFGAGFDRLLKLDPQEIQVGLLKRLKGTPIVRHTDEYEMVYSEHPPFEILQNRDIDFKTMLRLRRFARTWDLVGNSGNFRATLPMLWAGNLSPFSQLMELSDYLVACEGRLHGIALARLSRRVFDFLTGHCGLAADAAAKYIWADYTRNGRSDRPAFLRNFDLPAPAGKKKHGQQTVLRRQARHT